MQRFLLILLTLTVLAGTTPWPQAFAADHCVSSDEAAHAHCPHTQVTKHRHAPDEAEHVHHHAPTTSCCHVSSLAILQSATSLFIPAKLATIPHFSSHIVSQDQISSLLRPPAV